MQAITLLPSDRPRFPRGVRLHFDKVRNAPVLLGPEVALMLDPIGEAVLNEVDGAQDLQTIAQTLASRYAADVEMVTRDVAEFLEGLAERRLVDLT